MNHGCAELLCLGLAREGGVADGYAARLLFAQSGARVSV